MASAAPAGHPARPRLRPGHAPGPSTPLALLDLVCLAGERPERPLDFALVLHLDDAPPEGALRAGADNARLAYPVSGARLDPGTLRWEDPPAARAALVTTCSAPGAVLPAIAAFVDAPFDLRAGPPLRQIGLVLGPRSDPRAILVTRMHHAAGDGMSALLWLRHQLDVARGQGMLATGPLAPLELRRDVRREAPPRIPSAPLRGRPAPPSRARRWLTLELPAEDLRERAAAVGGFSYNDLLAALVLATCTRWNGGAAGAAGAGTVPSSPPATLWMPVGLRREAQRGFGNGASRIRVRAPGARLALRERCLDIRRQVAAARERGDAALPARDPFTRMPPRLALPALRLYLARPWLDAGTCAFSHLERWPGQDAPASSRVSRMDVIGLLHRTHAAAFNAVTLRDTTWLTLTWDPARLDAADAEDIAGLFLENVAAARKEL